MTYSEIFLSSFDLKSVTIENMREKLKHQPKTKIDAYLSAFIPKEVKAIWRNFPKKVKNTLAIGALVFSLSQAPQMISRIKDALPPLSLNSLVDNALEGNVNSINGQVATLLNMIALMPSDSKILALNGHNSLEMIFIASDGRKVTFSLDAENITLSDYANQRTVTETSNGIFGGNTERFVRVNNMLNNAATDLRSGDLSLQEVILDGESFSTNLIQPALYTPSQEN